MKKAYADYLIKKTKNDYNTIASDFSNTRQSFWNDSLFLLEYIKKNEKLLDLGCGNGRLYKRLQSLSVDYTGIDISEELIEEARKKNPGVNFLIGSATDLPFKDNQFDKIISIAVLHHIPSYELRIKFMEEVKRVLKKDGTMILTVWNLQDKKIARIKYFWSIIKKIFFSKEDIGDIYYPWKDSQGKIMVQRYIHLFKMRELKKLARRAGFLIENYGITHDKNTGKQRNFFLILKK